MNYPVSPKSTACQWTGHRGWSTAQAGVSQKARITNHPARDQGKLLAVTREELVQSGVGLAQRTAFLSGNECAAQAGSDVSFHLMGQYPITPSTEIAQNLDEKYANGENAVVMMRSTT